ncbi:MAG: hypothetical protein ABWY47_06405 [Xanthobacteraceae bacterium]
MWVIVILLLLALFTLFQNPDRRLPFIALVGVWIFLARQVQGARGTNQRQADQVDELKRHISELQKQLDERSNKDKK